MSYSTIHSQLSSILAGVTAQSGSLLTLYFPYEEPPASSNVTAFPYAQIISQESEEVPMDSISNATRYVFNIRVIHQHSNRLDMEQTMLSVADTLLDALRDRTRQTLTGTVHKFFPFTISWGFESGTASAPLRYFDINVTAEVLNDI